MNRDFLIEQVTPAIARKLVAAMAASKLYIDPVILEKAKEDIVHHDGTIEKLAQFIIDYDHRCVIPYNENIAELRKGIAASLPSESKVIFFDNPLNWNKTMGERLVAYKKGEDHRYRFLSTASVLNLEKDIVRDLLSERDCILVMKMEYPSQSNWLARAFPKTVAYCELQHQFSMFSPNTVNNSLLASAICLFPHLAADTKRLNSLPIEKILPLIGATPLFLKEDIKKQMVKR